MSGDKRERDPSETPGKEDCSERELRVQRVLDETLALSCGSMLKHDDRTVFVKSAEFVDAANAALSAAGQLSKSCIPQTVDLFGKVEVAHVLLVDARLHAALTCNKTYYSITIRSGDDGNEDWVPNSPELGDAGVWTTGDWTRWAEFLQFRSLTEKHWSTPGKGRQWLARKCASADILYPKIFPDGDGQNAGLVLITGGTGSGKTTILNALIAKVLAHQGFNPKRRRPHVVTAGDPVETLFYPRQFTTDSQGKRELSFALPEECGDYQEKHNKTRAIDFTQRTIGADVSSVEHALQDALRETPAIYIVSELRKTEDFKATLNFAATGQLIFATAHNTSLVDALRKLMIFTAPTDSASTRSILAQRVKAVIHLRKVELKDKEGNTRMIGLPTVWLGNSGGIRNFVCDGLASLLPHGSLADDSNAVVGTLGLAWAAEEMIRNELIEDKDCWAPLRKKAHELDLGIR